MSYFKLLLFSLSVLYVENVESNLIDSAVLTANSVYKHEKVTTVVWWDADREKITQFLKHFEGITATLSMNHDINSKILSFCKITGFQQTVFIISSTYEFEYFLKILNKYLITPIKLILLVMNSEIYISEITRISWNYDLSDILIISEDCNRSITLSTYFPYDGTKCGNHVPVTINKETDIMFPRKYINFHGCPIRTSTFHYTPYMFLKRVNNTVTSISGILGDIVHVHIA